jgi:hypothetical protein
MTPPKRAYTKRNRPAQAGELVGVRLQPAQLARIDAWRMVQAPSMTRPEAMRALIDQALDGLTGSPPMFDLSEIIFTERLTASPAPQTVPADAVEVWPENLQDSFILAADPATISRSHEIKPVRKPLPEKALDSLGPLGPLRPAGRRR